MHLIDLRDVPQAPITNAGPPQTPSTSGLPSTPTSMIYPRARIPRQSPRSLQPVGSSSTSGPRFQLASLGGYLPPPNNNSVPMLMPPLQPPQLLPSHFSPSGPHPVNSAPSGHAASTSHNANPVHTVLPFCEMQILFIHAHIFTEPSHSTPPKQSLPRSDSLPAFPGPTQCRLRQMLAL